MAATWRLFGTLPLLPPTGEPTGGSPLFPIASTSVDDDRAPRSFRVSSPTISLSRGLGCAVPFFDSSTDKQETERIRKAHPDIRCPHHVGGRF